MDVNEDGWVDLICFDFPGKEVYWFENPAGVETLWKRNLIDSIASNESPMMVDIDSDGKKDLVFGNETAEQASQRFQSAIDSILKKFPDQTTIVVAHGTVISLYVSHFNKISILSFWQELGLPSFVVLDVESKSMIAQENIE